MALRIRLPWGHAEGEDPIGELRVRERERCVLMVKIGSMYVISWKNHQGPSNNSRVGEPRR